MVVRGLTIAALTCLIAAAAAPAAKLKGWQIEQTIFGWGRLTLTICDKCMRLSDPTREYDIIIKAPLWHPIYLAEHRKIKAETSLENIHHGATNRFRMMTGGSSEDTSPSDWMPTTSAVVCNDPVQLYERKDKSAAVSHRNWRCYVSKDIPVTNQMTALIGEQFGIVNLGKLPLRFQTGTNKIRTQLDTQTIRKVTVDDSIFTVPSGFRNVKPEEVMFPVSDF